MDDCHEISKYLVDDQEHEYAIEWGNHALKNHQLNDDMEVKQVEILETLASAYNGSGKFREVAKLLPQILGAQPNSVVAAELKELMESEAFKAKNITRVRKEIPTLENILHRLVIILNFHFIFSSSSLYLIFSLSPYISQILIFILPFSISSNLLRFFQLSSRFFSP